MDYAEFHGGERGGEAIALFEAKAGRSAARKLALDTGKVGRSLRLERSREAVGGALITEAEWGGQVRRDIERLSPTVSSNLENVSPYDEFLSTIFIGPPDAKIGVKVKLSPTRTKIFGVLPHDVPSGSISKNLRALKYNFEVLGMDVAANELTAISAELVPSITTR